MEQKQQENWDKMPKWLQVILSGIGSFIKIPNVIWNLPILNKLKGVRLVVMSVLVGLNEAMGAFDHNMVAELSCRAAEMFNKICDPANIVLWFNIISGWLIAALAIEDKSETKGGTWFSGLFKKK